MRISPRSKQASIRFGHTYHPLRPPFPTLLATGVQTVFDCACLGVLVLFRLHVLACLRRSDGAGACEEYVWRQFRKVVGGVRHPRHRHSECRFSSSRTTRVAVGGRRPTKRGRREEGPFSPCRLAHVFRAATCDADDTDGAELHAGAGAEAAIATHFTPMPIPGTGAGGHEDNSRCDRDGGATWRCRADQFCRDCGKGRRGSVRGLPKAILIGHRDGNIDGIHGSSNGESLVELRRCRAASATSHR